MTLRKFPNFDVTMVHNNTYNLNLALQFDRFVVRPRNCQIDTHNTKHPTFWGRRGGGGGSVESIKIYPAPTLRHKSLLGDPSDLAIVL